jgi:hypothetical protein
MHDAMSNDSSARFTRVTWRFAVELIGLRRRWRL